jgi:hypothetical protein
MTVSTGWQLEELLLGESSIHDEQYRVMLWKWREEYQQAMLHIWRWEEITNQRKAQIL